jgi:hypothetical protein
MAKAELVHPEFLQALKDRIAALEAERDALQQRADAAEGLAGMLENILERYRWDMRQDDWEQYTAALAAYKQAGSK